MPTSTTNKRKKLKEDREAVRDENPRKSSPQGAPRGRYVKKTKAKSRRNSTQGKNEPAKPRR
jgi:hypothetical protein